MAYVVVGASAAGINAAKTLREINKDIELNSEFDDFIILLQGLRNIRKSNNEFKNKLHASSAVVLPVPP